MRYRGDWLGFRFHGHGLFSWNDSHSINGLFANDCPQNVLIMQPGSTQSRAVTFDGSKPVFHPSIRRAASYSGEVDLSASAASLTALQAQAQRGQRVSVASSEMSQQHLSFRILPSGEVDRRGADALDGSAEFPDRLHGPFAPLPAPLEKSGLKCTCHGEAKEGLNGLHRLRRPDTSVYIGEWLNGYEHGDGRWYDINRGTYEGLWSAGSFHGQGLFIFPDGTHS